MAYTLGDYCTLDDVRAHVGMGLDKVDDDAMIEEFINLASRQVDDLTGRKFYPVTETRSFDAVEDVDGRELILNADIVTVTTVVNGDGETLGSSTYVTYPEHESPKVAIRLLKSSGKSWTYQTDQEESIQVTGVWGATTSTPPSKSGKFGSVRLATTILALWHYQGRKGPFERQMMPELGVVLVPGEMPAKVKTLLRPHMRKPTYLMGI